MLAFAITMLATLWAWVEYTWLASAFDNDDWVFRVLTLLQMAGVIVLTIGVPVLFSASAEGERIGGGIMVLGYIIMRIAVVMQWLRVASHNPEWRRFAVSYAIAVSLVQMLWVVWIMLPLSFTLGLVLLVVTWVLDLSVPTLVARWSRPDGLASLPWNAHHLAERYALITIIALGETVIGTVTAAQEIAEDDGWNWATALVIAIGVVISFSLWWVYFLLPSGIALSVRRDKVGPWAYGHLPMLASIVATGGGLHLLGYLYSSKYEVSAVTAVSVVAVPIMVFMLCVACLHGWLVSSFTRNPAHFIAFGAPIVAIVGAALGWPVWACLFLVLAGPLTVVLCYELGEHRDLSAKLEHAMKQAGRG